MLKKLLDSRKQPVTVPTRASSLKRKGTDFFMSSSLKSFGLKKQQLQSNNNIPKNVSNNTKLCQQVQKTSRSKNIFKHDAIKDLIIKTQISAGNESQQKQNNSDKNYNNLNNNNNNIHNNTITNINTLKSLTKTNKQFLQLNKQELSDKLQNVSCLYSNFLYRNDQKEAFQAMKAERFRLMAINQREQKNTILKMLDQTKHKLTQKEKQKQTILFAYRMLQSKFKQKQQQNRNNFKKIQKENRQLLKINNSASSKLKNMKIVYKKQQKDDIEQFLTPSQRQILNKHNNNIQEQNQQKNNKLYEQENIINMQRINEIKQQLSQKQKQIQQMQQKYNNLDQNYKQQTNKNNKLTKQSQSLQQQILRLSKQIKQLQQQSRKQNQTISHMEQQYDTLQSKYNKMSLQFVDQQKQAQRRQQIIKQLQQTKYSYLMKQQRQRQQVQLLKRFTLNLKLNDAKINQFIRDTFGNQMSDNVTTGHKSFKEDISYILHLVKKKENIYNEFIKQYQEKLRETETRCFLLEKKMHLTDLFIRKLDDIVYEKCNKSEKGSQTQKDNSNSNSGISVTVLKTLMDSYKLDKRTI